MFRLPKRSKWARVNPASAALTVLLISALVVRADSARSDTIETDASTAPESNRGIENRALYFDGLDDVANILTTDALRFEHPAEWSFGMWIQLDFDDFAQPHILGIRSGCGGGPFFQVLSDRDVQSMIAASVPGCGAGIDGGLHYNEPTHYIWVFEADSLSMYMNGEPVGQFGCGPYARPNGTLLLGNSGTCPAHNMTGMMDDLWFRDRAMTPEEIAETWNCPVSVEDPSLVGYWNFDEEDGDQDIVDWSGLGHHGVLGSTAAVEANDPIRIVSPVILCDSPPKLIGMVELDPVGDCGATESLAGWTIVAEPVGDFGGDQEAATTDESGVYILDLEPGTWSVRSLPRENWEVTCNGGPQVVEAEAGNYNFLNFGARPLAGVKDLQVSLGSSPPPRPGFEFTYIATYQNTGSSSEDVVTEIELPPNVTFVSASTGFLLSGNVVSWTKPDVLPGQSGFVTVLVRLDVRASLGTVLAGTARVLPDEGDFDPEDNVDIDRAEIVGSFDPNDKLVTPEGVIPPDQTLTYRLRFQNVGTASAINIAIRDTLETTLDLSTLELTGSSHSYEFEIAGRELIWSFAGIELPDSTTNEVESHGFVEFEIDLVPELDPGTILQNRGGIYFDFNEVVLTNTVSNEILEPSSVDPEEAGSMKSVRLVALGPNPTTGSTVVHLELAQPASVVLAVYSVGGARVRQLAGGAMSAGSFRIGWDGVDDNGLPVSSGVYFVRAEVLAGHDLTTRTARVVVVE